MTRVDFEVAVVGAGPIGAATARHLAQEVVGVALIGPHEPESFRDHHGPWSGSYDEGRMAHAIDLPLLSGMIGLRARRRFKDLERATGVTFAQATPALTVAPAKPDVLEVPIGAGHPPEVTEAYFDVQSMLDRADDLGVRAQLLDEDHLKRAYPAMVFAAGHLAVHQPDALLLNPRRLVIAERTAAIQLGATHLLDEVIWVERSAGHFQLETRGGRRCTARSVVLAAGAYINLGGFTARPLAMSSFGATVTLAEVASEAATFPTTMYMKSTEHAPYAGIIAPPLRYPDGRWYIKGAGASLLEAPLEDAEQAEGWVRSGGDQRDVEKFAAVLAELLPTVHVGEISTRPCLVTINHTGHPYIGLVEHGLVVATEGEHGVTMADEIGRLAARVAIDGEWCDDLPAEVFAPRFL